MNSDLSATSLSSSCSLEVTELLPPLVLGGARSAGVACTALCPCLESAFVGRARTLLDLHVHRKRALFQCCCFDKDGHLQC